MPSFTSFSGIAGVANATISWSVDDETNIAYYSIIRTDGKVSTLATIPVGSSPYSYVLSSLTANTTYTLAMEARSISNSPIAISSTISVTPTASGGGSGVPCFPAGVRIRTPSGEKPVETLKTGDLVLTATGHAVPIRMHSYEIESATKANAPYFIPAGALGPRAPPKPLHLSPLHAFQIRPNVWWNAQEAAKASDKLEQYGLGEPLTYYHVECPNFLRDNLVADGVTVESFAAGQLTKAEKHNLYKYSKRLGGFVRNSAAAPFPLLTR
jgi:hypothetical protein